MLVAVHSHQRQASGITSLEARALPAQAERATTWRQHEQVTTGLRERTVEQPPADQAQPAQRTALHEHVAQRGLKGAEPLDLGQGGGDRLDGDERHRRSDGLSHSGEVGSGAQMRQRDGADEDASKRRDDQPGPSVAAWRDRGRGDLEAVRLGHPDTLHRRTGTSPEALVLVATGLAAARLDR